MLEMWSLIQPTNAFKPVHAPDVSNFHTFRTYGHELDFETNPCICVCSKLLDGRPRLQLSLHIFLAAIKHHLLILGRE